MEKKYNFTYQTKNLINGKTYLGVHSTDNLNDGYIGCGVYRQSDAERSVKRYSDKSYKYSLVGAVVKHGYENFKREILCFFETIDEAYEEESFIVDDKWVKRNDTYNISIGGNVAHVMYGKDNHKYRGDIYIVDKTNGCVIGKYESANQIKLSLNLNQSKISSTLRGKATGQRNLFFTRNPENWQEELEAIKKSFIENRRRPKSHHRAITAYNKDGTVYKEFTSITKACNFFGKGKNGTCYLDDVIDKFRKTDGLPLSAWGYYWKKKNYEN